MPSAYLPGLIAGRCRTLIDGLAASLTFWLMRPPSPPDYRRGGGSWLAFWQHGSRAFDIAGGADDKAAQLVAGRRRLGLAFLGRGQYDHDVAAVRAGIGRLPAGRDRV